MADTVEKNASDCIEIVDSPINPGPQIERVFSASSGAVVVFLGTVRDHSRGREVKSLEYDIYPEMALRELSAIAAAIREKWEVGKITIIHRFGVLRVGEISVFIAVSAPHREEAYAASRFAIESLKKTVPIWKKEVWDGGQEWIEGS